MLSTPCIIIRTAAQLMIAVIPTLCSRGIRIGDTIASPQLSNRAMDKVMEGFIRKNDDHMSPEIVVGRPIKPAWLSSWILYAPKRVIAHKR